MLETMYHAPGIGLAAIQIGVPQRLLVIDLVEGRRGEDAAVRRQPGDHLVERGAERLRGRLPVDPRILRDGDEARRDQGPLPRPPGRAQEMHATGLMATCLQHEIDHLNGVLFIDHISRLKRERVIKKFQKAQKLGKL